MMDKLIDICKMPQKELKTYLERQLKKLYDSEDIHNLDGFLYAQGEIPILLVAHMDTVHKQTPKKIVMINKNCLSSPQGIGGDDRCGIYAILQIIKNFKVSVLFTEDEEIGGVGARKFIKTELASSLIGTFNYIVEIDRKGYDDAVFYDCGNQDFKNYITRNQFWKENFGSYSDICDVAPVLGCAAVNLSSGYYQAHTIDEYINTDELAFIITKVCELIKHTTPNDNFEYIDEYQDDYYDKYYGIGDDYLYEIDYVVGDKVYFSQISGVNEYEVAGKFLANHPDMTFNQIEAIFPIS